MVRVVGCDPGTSSLDLLLLVDGWVEDQARFTPEDMRSDPDAMIRTLRRWDPLDLIAGPSGYGLPLVQAKHLKESDLDLMSHVRPDERGVSAGVVGFRGWVRAIVESGLPAVFLPGGIHLSSIPAHRKRNTIDLGTADKVAVVALALRVESQATGNSLSASRFAVVEVGSAFTAVLVVAGGQLVDAAAGTRGPIGMMSGGCWDGEVAYALSPISKADLFRGGVADLGEHGPAAFQESLRKHVAGLCAVTQFDKIYVSGAGLDHSVIAAAVSSALEGLGDVARLPSLPGAWVKHAAQGSALIADGLAGGSNIDVVESLDLRRAEGTIGNTIRSSRELPSSRD